MLNLEEMADRRITGANYITSVNGMVHPNRIMDVHDFLYILDGEWEIFEEDKAYHLSKDDLLILSAGRHHYGRIPCNAGNRHMYLHVLPTALESDSKHGLNSKRVFQKQKTLWGGWNPLLLFHAIPYCTVKNGF